VWEKSAYWDLVGRSKRKRPLERLRCRWEYIIKVYLKAVKLESINWTNLAQDRDSGQL
jgi:hypothetical protein